LNLHLTTSSLARLSAAPILPLWILALLLAAGVAAAILQYRSIRGRLGERKAIVLSLMRLSLFCMLLLFMLNISVTTRKEHATVPSIVILLDTSPSMNLPGSKDGTRLDEAKQVLLKRLLASLTQTYDIRLYGLGDTLRELGKEEVPTLKPENKRVNVIEALKKLEGRASLAVLLSDGTVKPPDSSGSLSNGSLSKSLPVLTIPAGDPAAYRDILVSAAKAPTVAFMGRQVTIDATIANRGYANVTIPVLLKDGARLVTAKSVHFTKSGESLSVSFSFTPGETGNHMMSVSTPLQADESITSNNIANLSMKVLRDKTRILFVSGTPSPNYRFMRMALKNDPSVDLLSFVILRTPSNVINVPLQEQSLIPFPVDTLFSEELKGFDLLIFDNLPLHVYLNQNHLESIKDFVGSGGAFALIGGPNMSDGGRIASTPLNEILPVAFAKEPDYSRSARSVRVTTAGSVHPVTRLSVDKALNLRLWSEMPPLDGVNDLNVRRSGMALLESTSSPPHPVLTVGSYGKGRVMALATDFSWKWGTGMVAQGGDNSAYLRFIERAVRWLTKDPALNPITMTLPERPEEGEDAEIKVKIAEDERLTFSVFGPEGIKLPSQVKSGGAPGEYIGSFRPERKGTYRLRAETGTGSLEELLVAGGRMEKLDGAPDHEFLSSISAATGGKVVRAEDDLVSEIRPYMEKAKKRYVEEKEVPLWSLPYAVAFVVAWLTAEWFLRRRWGLA